MFFANRWISAAYYVMLLVEFVPFPSDKVSDFSPCHEGLTTDPNQRFVYTLHMPKYCIMCVDVYRCLYFVAAAQAIEILQFVPGAGKSYVWLMFKL